jgi:hypothetical protein
MRRSFVQLLRAFDQHRATGTSAASGGFGPVGTTRMRSTTSMPSTTRPNTQKPASAGVSPRQSSWRLSTVLMKNCEVAEVVST